MLVAAGIVAPEQAHVGIAGHHQEVRLLVRAVVGETGRADFRVVGLQVGIVAEEGLGRVAQAVRRILDGLFVLTVIQVESGGERQGGLLVEMVLRDVVVVPDILQAFLDVLVDPAVDLGDIAAVILRVQALFRLVHVGQALVGDAGFLVVLEAEDIDQDEMGIGAGQQGLAIGFGQLGIGRTAHFLDGFQGLVRGADGHPEGGPDILLGIVAGLGDILPAPDLLVEAAGLGGHDRAVVVHVVGKEFRHHGVDMVRIGGAEQRFHLLGRIDLGPVIRHRVQELVAGNQTCKGGYGRNDVFVLHKSGLLIIRRYIRRRGWTPARRWRCGRRRDVR